MQDLDNEPEEAKKKDDEEKEEEARFGPDLNFEYYLQVLGRADSEWVSIKDTANLKIFKNPHMKGKDLMLKFYAKLPKIPREVAFTALTNLELRKKWDTMMKNIRIIEEKPELNHTIYTYAMNTPFIMGARDALVLRKIRKGFPNPDQWCMVQTSTTHPDCPEQKGVIRVNLTCMGIIFEEAPEIEGCKLTFLMHNDIKGSIPEALINTMAPKNPAMMMEGLTKASMKIIKGELKL